MKRGRFGSKNGQAMIEYLVLTVMLLASIAILSVFLYTFREQGIGHFNWSGMNIHNKRRRK